MLRLVPFSTLALSFFIVCYCLPQPPYVFYYPPAAVAPQSFGRTFIQPPAIQYRALPALPIPVTVEITTITTTVTSSTTCTTSTTALEDCSSSSSRRRRSLSQRYVYSDLLFDGRNEGQDLIFTPSVGRIGSAAVVESSVTNDKTVPYIIQPSLRKFNHDEVDPILLSYYAFVTGTVTKKLTSFLPIRVTATCKEATSYPTCDPSVEKDGGSLQLNDETIAERLRDYLSSARHLTVATTTTTFTTTSYCTYSTTSITTCLSIPVFGRRNLFDRRRQLLSNGDEEYASENSRLKDLPTILNEKHPSSSVQLKREHEVAILKRGIESSMPEIRDSPSSSRGFLGSLFLTKTTTVSTTVTFTNSIFAYCLSTTFWPACPA